MAFEVATVFVVESNSYINNISTHISKWKNCDGCQSQILHFFAQVLSDISEISLSIYKKPIIPIQIVSIGVFNSYYIFHIEKTYIMVEINLFY